MDFDFTEEQQAFRHEFRSWLEDNLPEGWLEGERRRLEDPDRRETFLREWQRKLSEGGWAGIHWPEEYGGRGAGLLEQVIYNQEKARVDAPPALNTIGLGMVGPTLMKVGTEAQKDRFLPPMLTGEEIWCQGYSEPEAGSDLASLGTRAEDDGEDYVINGQKIWTSFAHLADWCFLLARTEDTEEKRAGLTTMLVDMDQEAISVEPIHSINDTRTFNQVYFDDAVAKKEHRVGEEGKGWQIAITLLAFERMALSNVFSLERRWRELRDFCREQTRGGRPLSEDPRVRQRLAEFDTRIQALKLTYYRNISKQVQTGDPGPEGSMDKVGTTELMLEMENFAVGLLGPRSSLWGGDHPVFGRWQYDYLSSFGQVIAGGTADIQRNIIGERVLGLPRDVRE